MWFLDGPEYYAPPGAHYLTYDNDVRRVVEQVAAQRYPGGAMPVFYKHLVSASYQLALFRWVDVWMGRSVGGWVGGLGFMASGRVAVLCCWPGRLARLHAALLPGHRVQLPPHPPPSSLQAGTRWRLPAC